MFVFNLVGSCVAFVAVAVAYVVMESVHGNWIEFWFMCSSMVFLFACFYDRYPRGRAFDAYQNSMTPYSEQCVGRIAVCGAPLILVPYIVLVVVVMQLIDTNFARASYVLPFYIGLFVGVSLIRWATRGIRAK